MNKKIFIFIFSILISFFILEIFTRLVVDDGINYNIEMLKYANQLKIVSKNKEVGIEHKKNTSAKLMGAEVFLNSDGFRNNYNVNINNKKILMLGDSMTFGWGAQNTFSNILENKLKEYQVLNAGIGNTNTIMQINNFFFNLKDKYNYDLIVLNFFINDLEDVKINNPNYLKKYSLFYSYFLSLINKVSIKYKKKNDWISFYQSTFLNKEIKEESFNQILKLKAYCDKNNIKFFIHNIPELRDLKNYQFIKETEILKKFSENNGIIFYDSFDILKEFNEPDLWVTRSDSHANNLAHKIIGEGLSKFILKIL